MPINDAQVAVYNICMYVHASEGPRACSSSLCFNDAFLASPRYVIV